MIKIPVKITLNISDIYPVIQMALCSDHVLKSKSIFVLF